MGAAAGVLALLGTATPAAAGPQPIDQCTTTSGVVLAVDLGKWGGPMLRSCGTTPTTGYELLNQGGWRTTGTGHDGPAFICRIGYSGYQGGKQFPPPEQEKCVLTPPASAYWSYWHADPGENDWSYSQLGAMSYHPKPGSVDLWIFGGTNIEGTEGRPTVSPDSLRARNTTPGGQGQGGAGSTGSSGGTGSGSGSGSGAGSGGGSHGSGGGSTNGSGGSASSGGAGGAGGPANGGGSGSGRGPVAAPPPVAGAQPPAAGAAPEQDSDPVAPPTAAPEETPAPSDAPAPAATPEPTDTPTTAADPAAAAPSPTTIVVDAAPAADAPSDTGSVLPLAATVLVAVLLGGASVAAARRRRRRRL
ncbi:hypothetical protein [Kitasatospora brasiliensis]|uniref:hypothetical protein n=1 Tax=Kitasatospora brasiliensis TaxID=3058040 RepID=UPI002931ABB9|nr:hypothetical protein [Kitasatospora sp. K002]